MGIGKMYFSPLYDLFLSGDEVYLSILRFQSRDQNWRNHFRRPCWKIYKAFIMADVTSSSHIDIVFDDYWLTLDDITKARYRYKALLYGFDPYKLKKSDFSEDLSLLPAVQYPDIVNYFSGSNVLDNHVTNEILQSHGSLQLFRLGVGKHS